MALKKILNPTYPFKVEIPVPGAKPEKCGFVFKYATDEEYEALKSEHGSLPLVEFLPFLIDDWEKKDFSEFGEFSAEALKAVANVYPGAPQALLQAYLTSRYQGRVGN